MLNVSIIVPVFNSEKFLDRCIQSLLNQTIDNYEIILVNDASNDSSLEIMNSYKERYPSIIKVIDSKVNQRQGGARNLGIKSSIGEYIGFVDSDDWVKPEMFKKLFEMAKSRNLDVVGCNYIIKKGDSEKIVRQYDNYNWNEAKVELSLSDKKKLLIEGGSVWSKIYKKKMITENNIYFPVKMAYEDNFFVPLVSYYTNSFGVVKEALYYYFQDNTEATTKKKNSLHHFDRIKTSNMMYDWFQKNDINMDFIDEIEYLYIKYNYLNTTNMLLSQFTETNWKKLKELRDDFIEKYPNYNRNIYYISNYSLIKRLIIGINRRSIYTYAFLYKAIHYLRG